MTSARPEAAPDVFAQPGWWDRESRAFASLRAVNELRLRLLHQWLGNWLHAAPRTVLDLGCGGGLMAVPLAKAGAIVLGIDTSLPALREARAQGCRRAAFVRGDLGSLPVPPQSADLVLLCDVLEHVDDPAAVLQKAATLLRPGGRMFVNTINRTLRARLLAVTLAEGLGLIPRGTHDPRRFVRPQEVATAAVRAGLRVDRWFGERPALLASLRRGVVCVREGSSLAVGYGVGLCLEDA
jgi:2-polyprenyl-6-hydroxyphenyl methylase/3-demethylubiquinone-9 3-methyltransferase